MTFQTGNVQRSSHPSQSSWKKKKKNLFCWKIRSILRRFQAKTKTLFFSNEFPIYDETESKYMLLTWFSHFSSAEITGEDFCTLEIQYV